jgi:Alpha/beta hydrolase domain
MAELRDFSSAGERGAMYLHSLYNLAPYGFVERELVVAGDASGEPYATRVIVRHPVEKDRFNGRVVVEWLNVTTGSDVEILWCSTREMLMREGYGWVGLSAQPLGIASMQRWDPRRYGELRHPAMPAGDLPAFVWDEPYSDEIFLQVGELLRSTAASELFGRTPDVVVAHGQSQSSMRLTALLARSSSAAAAYDGYLLHAGGGTAIRGRQGIPDMEPVTIPDGGVKVLKVNSEAEASGYRPHVQADSDSFAYWEVAGTGHTPVSYLDDTLLRRDHSGFQRDRFEWRNSLGPRTIEYALRAAVAHLCEWTLSGARPPAGSLIEMTDGEIARDEHGNAQGGVRLPHVDVPAGRYLAVNDDDHRLHPGFVVHPVSRLRERYGDPDHYEAQLWGATADAVSAGFVLEGDAADLVDDLAELWST